MWVSTHTSISLRSHINDLLFNASVFIEEFFWFVAKQPLSQLIQMLWFFHRHRNLMRTERTFDFLSVYYSWTCPSLWSTKYDHWPSNSLCIVVFTSMFLNCFNFLDTAVHSLAHSLVHSDMIFRIDTIVHFIFCFYKDWIPSTSLEEILYFFM